MPATATGLWRPPHHLGTQRPEYVGVLRSDPCAYCPLRPSALEATVDHIVARAAGGGNTLNDLAGACSACNGQKGSRSLLIFLLERL